MLCPIGPALKVAYGFKQNAAAQAEKAHQYQQR
jgi:hypothetical protein